MNYSGNSALLVGVLLGAGFILGSCGGTSVAGSTYESAGGAVKIEFQSGGKAFVSMGPLSSPCTYDQNGKIVTLTCERDKTDFTLNDDGSLNGPPNGMLGRLTKKKV